MHDHSHDPGPAGSNQQRLALVLGLSALYMVAEIVGGLWTGSLALLADAGHMASDVAALALSLFAAWMVTRPATTRRTYGHRRAEILAALAQGVALVAVAFIVTLEAIERLEAPPRIGGGGVLLVATGGLFVNIAGLYLLNHGRHSNLNMRGAWLHVASDALGSIGAIFAGFAIWRFGWNWADPAASLVISLLILAGAWQLLREAVDVLMETAPRHLDVEEIREALRSLPRVDDIHDLHVWTIGSGEVSLSSHIVAQEGAESSEILLGVYGRLQDRFGIGHATIQIEPASFADPDCTGGCQHAQEAAAQGS